MIKVVAPRIALKIIDQAIQAFGAAGVSDQAGLARTYLQCGLPDGLDEVHCRTVC